MGSPSYTPRHGSSKGGRRGISHLVSTVRRPVVGGALALGLLGSVGATVAFGDPANLNSATAAISSSSPSSETTTDDAATDDTASLSEDRRESNVSRSSAREQERRKAVEEKKKNAERTERAERKKQAERKKEAAKAAREEKKRENEEKPVSERDFTREQLAEIRKDPKPYAVELLREHGWDDDEWGCLDQLWIGESDWEWDATNPSSGAYGIPQSLPANKMASVDSDWKTNPITQMVWGLDYIEQSYGSPCEAKEFWDSKDPHWY